MPDMERINRPHASNPHPANNSSLEIGAPTPGDDWFCLSWLDRSESMSASRRPPSERPVLPGYEIMRELGRGGMGVVYLCRDLELKRRVAIKVMREGSIEAAAVDRGRAELEAVGRLRHPNIVQVYETGEYLERPFLVLEHVAGPNLHEFLGGKPLLPRTAAELLESIARAVEHAHQHEIFHGDLKPSNILLSSDEVVGLEELPETPISRSMFRTPKITDFGVIKFRPINEDLAAAARFTGPTNYAAPERVNSFGDIGPESDVYSLGAILYEMLTGRPPFNAADPAESLQLARDHDAAPPRQLQPNLPRDLETICLKCLRKEPRHRYVGAEELADDLRRFLEGRPIVARPIGPIARSLRWARRNPILALLSVVIAILLLALILDAASLVLIDISRHSSRPRARVGGVSALAARGSEPIGQDCRFRVCSGKSITCRRSGYFGRV